MLGVPPQASQGGMRAGSSRTPMGWWGGRAQLRDILGLRASMVASAARVDARNPLRLYEQELSVAASSLRPVDVEVKADGPPVGGGIHGSPPGPPPHPPLVRAVGGVRVSGSPPPAPGGWSS